jgi:hypothetical protein
LILEDQSYNEVVQTTVGANGHYRFAHVPATSRGYNVLFVQESNESIYDIDQAISYGWMGPVAVTDGATVELPDFEISLLSFGQRSPEPNATVSAASITAESPLTFEWTSYSPAATYWVDLVQGEEQDLVWQSSLVQTTSLSFDGTLANGAHIQPGQYGWAVGARRVLEAYTLTVYGYVAGLTIES